MLKCKESLNKKERKFVGYILDNTCDLYSDFYVTKDNVRIPLRDNPEILYEYLNKGDVIVYEEDNETGIGLVTGWSDKAFRKYVKILTKDEHLASNLLKIINWNANINLYAKLKKNNPLVKIFLHNQYKFKGDRGSEVLLCREYRPRLDRPIYKKDEEGE